MPSPIKPAPTGRNLSRGGDTTGQRGDFVIHISPRWGDTTGQRGDFVIHISPRWGDVVVDTSRAINISPRWGDTTAIFSFRRINMYNKMTTSPQRGDTTAIFSFRRINMYNKMTTSPQRGEIFITNAITNKTRPNGAEHITWGRYDGTTGRFYNRV